MQAAEEEISPGDRVLEVGVGTGYVAENLQEAASTVVGTDVNPAATRRARDRGVEAVTTDLAHGVQGEFDLVVFNPPYLPDADDTPDDALDAALSGGESGVETAERFVRDLPRLLSPEGSAFVVASSHGDVDRLKQTARTKGFTLDVAARDRFFFEELYVLRLKR